MLDNKKQIRSAAGIAAIAEETEGRRVVEGCAVKYDSPTLMYKEGDVEFYERIARGAFDMANMKDCCLKYNHMDSVPILARTRGGSLKIDMRDDGIYFRAELFDTSIARDCYELVRQNALQCSFAFTIATGGKSYDAATRTRSINKADHLFDISLVDIPAYDDTFVTARSLFELDREDERLESLKRRKRLILETYF